MSEPKLWTKRISEGRQIAVPAELMRELNLSIGDSIYLVLSEGRVILLPESEGASLLKQALEGGGLIPPTTRRRRRA